MAVLYRPQTVPGPAPTSEDAALCAIVDAPKQRFTAASLKTGLLKHMKAHLRSPVVQLAACKSILAIARKGKLSVRRVGMSVDFGYG